MGKDFNRVIDEVINYRDRDKAQKISETYKSIVDSLISKASVGAEIETSLDVTNIADYSVVEIVVEMLEKEGFAVGFFGSGNSIFINATIDQEKIESFIDTRRLIRNKNKTIPYITPRR